jgi:phytanoyl-CoA hydroxylase
VAGIPYAVRAQLHQVRARLERGVRQTLWGGRPSWQRRENRRPWFDGPDARAEVPERARRAAADGLSEALLEKWVRDGYVVVDDVVDLADVDAMVADLDALWDARVPVADLVLLDLRETLDAPPRNLTHAELLALDPATRRRMREASDWRIHGFHYVNAAARRLYTDHRLRDLVSRLFDRRARPIANINFMVGSQQSLHQDMAVFHIFPHDWLIGAWIACEDVAEGSGPLVLHAGSHQAPFFPEFTDYPQTNLRTADPETAARYHAWVDGLAARYERREFHARKGQVLLWHGMLIHCGAPVTRRGSSRKSMVIHYSLRGADRGREVHGPFNW